MSEVSNWVTTVPREAMILFKNGTIPASFSLIFGLFKQTIQFIQQINVKNVHLVFGAGIRTHDLKDMGRQP